MSESPSTPNSPWDGGSPPPPDASAARPSVLRSRGFRWLVAVTLGTFVLAMAGLASYWSMEPPSFDVEQLTQATLARLGGNRVPGYTVGATLVHSAEVLLTKPGGYVTNDRMPPGVLLDNIEHWEFGVLAQVRDLSRSMRQDFCRSMSQSREDEDLANAEPAFNNDSHSWMFPSAEDKYREGITYTENFLRRLNDNKEEDAQFYARSDNLVRWLMTVEKKLGSMSQRLTSSVGSRKVSGLAGDPDANQATPAPDEDRIHRTPWAELDDNFYEARGTAWALLHYFRAVAIDFQPILEKKNAMPTVKGIIRELEATQQAVWSPVILNGSGFGWEANHSLVMASYLSRATAGILDLRSILEKG